MDKSYVIITINADMRSDLKWESALKEAKDAVECGKMILWDIDLGLDKDIFPFNDPSQYHGLQISLDHFKESVWNQFSEHTMGAILYKGPIDFTKNIPQDESRLNEWLKDHNFETCDSFTLQLYARDLFIDWLDLLIIALPAEIQPYLLFDLSTIDSFAKRWQLASPEHFHQYKLSLNETEVGPCAILLPRTDIYDLAFYEKIESLALEMTKKKEKFRFIPESFLQMQWEGLNQLVYDPKALSPIGKRMLQGFLAAGGTAISVNDLI